MHTNRTLREFSPRFSQAFSDSYATSIQTWALEEARRRLEVEGVLEDPFPDHPRTRRSDQPQ